MDFLLLYAMFPGFSSLNTKKNTLGFLFPASNPSSTQAQYSCKVSVRCKTSFKMSAVACDISMVSHGGFSRWFRWVVEPCWATPLKKHELVSWDDESQMEK